MTRTEQHARRYRRQRLTPDELNSDQRTLYHAIAGGRRSQGPQHFPLTDVDGSLRGPFDAFLISPGVGTALQELGAAIRFDTSLDDQSREVAILLTAAWWRSDFEWEAHEAIGRAVGLTDSELNAIRDLDITGLQGLQLAVAGTVLTLLKGDITDDDRTRAVEQIGEQTLFELTTVVGYYSLLALQLRVFNTS